MTWAGRPSAPGHHRPARRAAASSSSACSALIPAERSSPHRTSTGGSSGRTQRGSVRQSRRGTCERHVRQRAAKQPGGPAEALERRLAVHAGAHARQPPADGGGPGRGPDHRPPVGCGDWLRYLEGKAALPQPPQDPVLGADLFDGKEPADS